MECSCNAIAAWQGILASAKVANADEEAHEPGDVMWDSAIAGMVWEVGLKSRELRVCHISVKHDNNVKWSHL